MTNQPSHDFVLWAIPRFRRSYGVSNQAVNLEGVRKTPPASKPVVDSLANLPISAKRFATDENPEAACCFTAYH